MNTDSLTTITASISSAAGLLAFAGVLPQVTAPVALLSHLVGGYFTNK